MCKWKMYVNKFTILIYSKMLQYISDSLQVVSIVHKWQKLSYYTQGKLINTALFEGKAI